MKTIVILVGAMMAMGVADSLAQGPPEGRGGGGGGRGGNQLMNALDKNGDGMLDSGEIQSASLSLRTLDKNKDFKLTADELGIRQRGDMSQRLMEMDANKDGKLTSDEVPERMNRWMERMDANGDGAIDKAEMDQFQKEMRQRWEEGGGPPRGDRGGPGRGGPPSE
jgi:hypothetical protein